MDRRTGRTLLTKSSNGAGANFVPIRGPELRSKWVGESEEAVRETFQTARAVAPSIVLFDELDGLATSRSNARGGAGSDRIVNQLLTELDGLRALEDVPVIGATNRPEMLDRAFLRPGRLDRLIRVGAPTVEDRRQILRVHTRGTP